MSNVKIEGNASGTGTFTIQAPNSNTDRTLTLPDEAGTVLTSASDITQNSGPAFSAWLSAAQSVTTATFTKVQVDNERFDAEGSYDNATNYRFQPTIEGYYQFNCILAPGGSVTRYIIAPHKNGSEYLRVVDSLQDGSTNKINRNSGSFMAYMNGSTDYMEFYAYLIGTSLTFDGGASYTSCEFSGHLVRAV